MPARSSAAFPEFSLQFEPHAHFPDLDQRSRCGPFLPTILDDAGATPDPPGSVCPRGAASQGTHAPGQVGHVAVTYYAKLGNNTTSDGFITETRDALDDNPVFWSGQVNKPDRPLLYNTPGVNMGLTVLDFLGGALSMDGRSAWGAWVQDCGDNLVTDVRCRNRLPAQNPANPQDGFAGRLVWPS